MADVYKFPQDLDISDECVHADVIFKRIEEIPEKIVRAELHLQLFAMYHGKTEFYLVPEEPEETE
jgi:hypothetical protein